jgi:hypothetical protein
MESGSSSNGLVPAFTALNPNGENNTMSYRTYKFRGQDPVIGQIKTMFLNKEDMKKVELSELSNVSSTTIYNWFSGKTRRPMNATIEATGRALGFQRKWVPYNGGRATR